MNVGTVQQITRYPLKSAGGQAMTRCEVDQRGLVGDRSHAVEVRGVPANAKALPQLPGWRASLGPDGLQVDTGTRHGDAADVLAHELPGARLVTSAQGHRMSAAVHLVSADAAQAPDAPSGCDADPRANLVLELGTPGGERQWLDRTVRIGEVMLRITRLPKHCLGVYADVVEPGTISLGDTVRVE
ncbi:MAG: MOSC N-terminal beta barrel domain-containing protein [Actinomycetales bacterium]